MGTSPQLRKYQRRIEDGLCVACGKTQPVTGNRRCQPCREKRAKVSQSQKNRCPEGICRQCCIRPCLDELASCGMCRERGRKKMQETYRDIRREVLQIYGGRCVCCGNSNPKYLQLDHVNNDGGMERKQLPPHVRGGQFYKYVLKLGYIRSDLQLLCANCHNARRYGGCTSEDHPSIGSP